MMTDPSNPSGETARIAELNEKLTEAICRLPLRQDHPDVGKRLKAVSDAQFNLVDLLSRLSASPAPVTIPVCPDDCLLCSAEACETHGIEPCACDVVQRHLKMSASSADVGPTDSERRVREGWWLNHGHPISDLYGDDGEMQCGACRLDFLRMTLAELAAHLTGDGRLHAGRVQAADVGPQAQGITDYDVLQAVLWAISGTLDPHSQIADHPNVKFAQMERLKLLTGTVSQAQEKA
jgi:hypothetical protein